MLISILVTIISIVSTYVNSLLGATQGGLVMDDAADAGVADDFGDVPDDADVDLSDNGVNPRG